MHENEHGGGAINVGLNFQGGRVVGAEKACSKTIPKITERVCTTGHHIRIHFIPFQVRIHSIQTGNEDSSLGTANFP